MVLNKKYKGNTLPEVLIAIVIISFSSALGMMIYINIQENTQPFLKLKANDIAKKTFETSMQNQDYFDNTYHEEEFIINKTSQRSEIYPDCVLLKISISNNTDKKIYEIQKIIHVD